MAAAHTHIKQIFLTAIEQYPPDQWPSYVEHACGNDPGLRRRVELLLEAHIGDESLLDQPVIALNETAVRSVAEKAGDTIGPYKLREQIGEGGMGLVFVAEQTAPVRRQVAFKVCKPGMDTKEVMARFEAERQALAVMDHPNIAKVIAA